MYRHFPGGFFSVRVLIDFFYFIFPINSQCCLCLFNREFSVCSLIVHIQPSARSKGLYTPGTRRLNDTKISAFECFASKVFTQAVMQIRGTGVSSQISVCGQTEVAITGFMSFRRVTFAFCVKQKQQLTWKKNKKKPPPQCVKASTLTENR